MQPGDRVRVIDNPSRVGFLTSDPPIAEGRRQRLVVSFSDGIESVLAASLEKVEAETTDPYLLMKSGRYGGASHLRGAITYLPPEWPSGQPHLQHEHDKYTIFAVPVQAGLAVPGFAQSWHSDCG